MNTYEKPVELSRENMISSHIKITCYLHMGRDRGCYGYIINHDFYSESWKIPYFISGYIIHRI